MLLGHQNFRPAATVRQHWSSSSSCHETDVHTAQVQPQRDALHSWQQSYLYLHDIDRNKPNHSSLVVVVRREHIRRQKKYCALRQTRLTHQRFVFACTLIVEWNQNFFFGIFTWRCAMRPQQTNKQTNKTTPHERKHRNKTCEKLID